MVHSFHFDKRGQWSGGGKAFLNNVAHAEKRHAILRGGAESIPIIPRNVPVKEARKYDRFLLAPQNALAWAPSSKGLKEFMVVTGLRLASSFYYRQTSGVIRISESIPPAKGRPASPVIHNVLDPAFEAALKESVRKNVERARGKLVCIGSGHSYRNLTVLIEGFHSYKVMGGMLDLWIAGRPGSARARTAVDHAAEGVNGLDITWRALSRSECLAALRSAAGVILPSLVEASPVAALEAAAVNPNVALSDIAGHRGILSEYGDMPSTAYFDPRSSDEVAVALRSITLASAINPHQTLSNRGNREEARILWGDRVSTWLSCLNFASN